MQPSPIIAIHICFAVSAVLLGPIALWARLGRMVHPRLHRAMGYAWVTCMVGAACSSLFIHSYSFINIAGFSPIHLLVIATFITLYFSFKFLAQGKIKGHRLCMQWLYFGACLVAGAFTFMPGRFMGQWVRSWL